MQRAFRRHFQESHNGNLNSWRRKATATVRKTATRNIFIFLLVICWLGKCSPQPPCSGPSRTRGRRRPSLSALIRVPPAQTAPPLRRTWGSCRWKLREQPWKCRRWIVEGKLCKFETMPELYGIRRFWSALCCKPSNWLAVSHLMRLTLAVPTTSLAIFLTKFQLRGRVTTFTGSAATRSSVSKSAHLTCQFLSSKTFRDPKDHFLQQSLFYFMYHSNKNLGVSLMKLSNVFSWLPRWTPPPTWCPPPRKSSICPGRRKTPRAQIFESKIVTGYVFDNTNLSIKWKKCKPFYSFHCTH